MILRPVQVSSRQFSWFNDKRMYVAEISDLGGRFGRVYDDACDVGLTVVSQYDERDEIVFVVDHTEVKDGDTLWWDLKPAKPSDKNCGFTLRVFND